jgi:hypothetical protein
MWGHEKANRCLDDHFIRLLFDGIQRVSRMLVQYSQGLSHFTNVRACHGCVVPVAVSPGRHQGRSQPSSKSKPSQDHSSHSSSSVFRACQVRACLFVHGSAYDQVRETSWRMFVSVAVYLLVKLAPLLTACDDTQRSPPSLTAIPMSTRDQTPNASTSNFTPIFQTACDEYKRLTGHDLATHPFATELDHCNSPDGILDVLGKQSQAFATSRKRNEKLLAWLSPIVHVLFTFFATLGEGIGLVSISPLCVTN